MSEREREREMAMGLQQQQHDGKKKIMNFSRHSEAGQTRHERGKRFRL